MPIHLREDIRSVTDLKRNTKEIFDQIHQTKRPVVLTINGKADAVLIDAETYEKRLEANNLGKLLFEAEKEVQLGKTRTMKTFLKEFKNGREI